MAVFPFSRRNADSAFAELPSMSFAVMAVGLSELMKEADGLPQPRSVIISQGEIFLMEFPPARDSCRDIARWALRFGGVLVREAADDDPLGPAETVDLRFSYYGIEVGLFAAFPV